MKCIYLCVRSIVLFLVSVPALSQQKNNPTAGHCKDHEECPDSQACIKGKCTDPCDGLCGENTSCTVLSHVPTCACKKDFSGNPFHGCSRLETCSGFLTQGKKKFYLGSKKGTWMEAVVACASNNTRLATVESMEEINEINELAKHKQDAWTSGTDLGHGYQNFTWALTGKPLPKKSELWIKRPVQQPDNNGGYEHCVDFRPSLRGVYNPGLNDRPCHAPVGYACEYYE